MNQKTQTCHLLLYSFLSKSKMAKIQGSDELMKKRKIAILNIDSILNKKNLGRKKCQSAKVLITKSLKWVYMFNAVEKWMHESQITKKPIVRAKKS
jgi:hypothetical protein